MAKNVYFFGGGMPGLKGYSFYEPSVQGPELFILNNEISFAVAAEFYSCDPGSQANGGDFGTVTRGDFVPEFDAIAFNVPIDSVSEIFETPLETVIFLTV